MHFDYQSLSGTLLYLVSFLIIFSESGIFFLFFLPGDSLLFALGLLANKGSIEMGYIIPVLVVAAIAGNFLGYFLGQITRGGLEQGKYLPKVKPEYLERAKIFYDKHGLLAILLARFVPIIRTFVPFFAGVVVMRQRTFTFWTIIGGIAWVSIVVLFGYFLGREFNLEHIAYLGTMVVVGTVIATPVFIAVIRRFVR